MENSPTDHPSLHLHGSYFCFSGLLPRSYRPALPALSWVLWVLILPLWIFLASLGPLQIHGQLPLSLALLPVSVMSTLVPVSVGLFSESPQTAPMSSVLEGLSPPASLCVPLFMRALWVHQLPSPPRSIACLCGLLPCLAALSLRWASSCPCPCGLYGPWSTSVALDGCLHDFLCIFLHLRSPLPQLHGLLPRSPASQSLSPVGACAQGCQAGSAWRVVESGPKVRPSH